MADDRFGIVGKVIARTYEIRAVVAEGGFGVVYRAYHQGFRAEVALKCLKIPNELTDAQRTSFLEQFRSEAEVLFRLSGHSGNIVRPLHVDAFHTADELLVPFMAMEWLEGKTLDGLILERARKGKPPLSLRRIVRLLTPVATALELAHHLPGKNGPEIVVHRDMKPENLFIARVAGEDVAKVLDFGISKVKSTASQMVGRASVQKDALVSFSPAYGAPEQWAPRRFGQTGCWTDVWGLALTVVEAAKGAEVIEGDHAEMMGTILDPERRPTPRNEGIEVSDEVERVFAQALALDPKNRYQGVGKFWDALSQALGIQDEVGGSVSVSRQKVSRRATTGFDSVFPPPDDAQDPLALSVVPPRPGGSPNTPSNAAVSRLPTEINPASAIAPAPSTGFGGGMPVATRPVATRPTSSVQSGRVRPMSSYAPSERPPLFKSLGPTFALIALSVALTLLDRAHAHTRGVPFSVAGIQASWVAGGLMLLALIIGYRTIRDSWEE